MKITAVVALLSFVPRTLSNRPFPGGRGRGLRPVHGKKQSFIWGLVLLLFFFFHSYAYAQDFIVVVNKDGLLNDVNMDVIKKIYLGEKKFVDSTKIMPIHLKEGPAKDAFLKTVVGMSSKEYKHYSLQKLFQEGLQFHSIAIPVEIVEFVSKEKGAVAYLLASWTTAIQSGIGRGTEEIKIIGP